ncbi:MAG: 3-methyl-2-oxobutanoate hydroxymethyltransferase [Clostridiales Family XIII bacterium]|jgi:3-methyl-2-oxobutanoate hydroxymethyltransferase|nr:3-methyl-2-oxobutanoate hydroxymethyltransferase [Clostridiales Family XIII bacterium]
MKNTTLSLQEKKQKNEKITMLTAYDYSTAKLMDSCGIDVLLVGDSLGMVMLGHDTTLPVTMDDMIHHAKAVARACETAMVVADMPFMSYQVSVPEAVANAGRLIKECGVAAVKLEGGADVCPQIEAIAKASIPVMAHLGLTPQSINALGGFKVQGKDRAQARRLIEDARAVERAGAFAVVLECVPAGLAALITELLRIPTVGIGAGKGCDGQVLVYQDMLSLYPGNSPKFVKRYADVGSVMRSAFQAYIEETRSGAFPGEEHGFKIDDGILRELRQGCGAESL